MLKIPYLINNNMKLRKEMAEWISSFKWTLYATITFRYIVRDPIQAKKIFNIWIADIEKITKQKVNYFIVCERDYVGSEVHIHALINIGSETNQNNKTNLNTKLFWDIAHKKFGRTKIETYKQNLGAEYYLTKYITKDIHDWDINYNNTI